MERAPLFAPLSPVQEVIADLLGIGQTYAAIADALEIKKETVREHTQLAAAKIPGDLPPMARVVAWARGATVDVLTGNPLKVDVMNRSVPNRRYPRRGSIARKQTSQ